MHNNDTLVFKSIFQGMEAGDELLEVLFPVGHFFYVLSMKGIPEHWKEHDRQAAEKHDCKEAKEERPYYSCLFCDGGAATLEKYFSERTRTIEAIRVERCTDCFLVVTVTQSTDNAANFQRSITIREQRLTDQELIRPFIFSPDRVPPGEALVFFEQNFRIVKGLQYF